MPIISTFWGDPAPYVDLIHAAGALHLHSVGSVTEAAGAAQAGVDVIVAQGGEAGGHVRGTTSTLALVPPVVDAVDPVPVVAAGGIADARGVVAVLSLGAQAAWLGTRFLLAAEANVHPEYRSRLLAARPRTRSTPRRLTAGGPMLRTASCATPRSRHGAAGRPAAPHRPGEGDVIATAPDGGTLMRYHMALPQAGTDGEVGEMALYAGQGVGLARACAPAADIVSELRDGARRLLG